MPPAGHTHYMHAHAAHMPTCPCWKHAYMPLLDSSHTLAGRITYMPMPVRGPSCLPTACRCANLTPKSKKNTYMPLPDTCPHAPAGHIACPCRTHVHVPLLDTSHAPAGHITGPCRTLVSHTAHGSTYRTCPARGLRCPPPEDTQCAQSNT